MKDKPMLLGMKEADAALEAARLVASSFTDSEPLCLTAPGQVAADRMIALKAALRALAGGRVAGAAAGLIGQADVHLAAQEGAHRQHHRARVQPAKFVEAFRQRLAQLDIERIGFAVHNGHDGNAAVDFQIDHDRLICAAPAVVSVDVSEIAPNGPGRVDGARERPVSQAWLSVAAFRPRFVPKNPQLRHCEVTATCPECAIQQWRTQC